MTGGRETHPWLPATKGFQPLRNHRLSKRANLWLPIYEPVLQGVTKFSLILVLASSLFHDLSEKCQGRGWNSSSRSIGQLCLTWSTVPSESIGWASHRFVHPRPAERRARPA